MMDAALRLPLGFDPAALLRDLDRLNEADWFGHFNTTVYEGEWSGLPLRATATAEHPVQALHNTPGSELFADQSILAECPAIRAVMAELHCPLRSVRLLRLGAGAVIREHTDHALGFGFGEVRLHVPVTTNPAVDFRVEGRQLDMRPGELWYIDASRRHSVANRGRQARVHLVVDCVVNPWLQALLEAGVSPPPAASRAAEPAADQPVPQPAPVSAPHAHDPGLVGQIIGFIRDIGIAVETCELGDDTFLPGIAVRGGTIRVDPGRLRYPGDLLHEAGHIAVTPAAQRAAMGDDAGDEPADEMMAIAWSWAASVYLGLDPGVVFHPDGYKGDAQWLIETFGTGHYIGLPMLQWIGLSADPQRAAELGVAPYPAMLRWLRA